HAPFETTIAALGQPDGAHASLTDQRQEAVCANRLSGERLCQGRTHGRQHRLLEEARLVDQIVLDEELLEIGGERGIARENGLEPCPAAAGGNFERLVQVRAERAPAISGERHEASRQPSPRRRWRDAGTGGPSPSDAESFAPIPHASWRSRRTTARRRTSTRSLRPAPVRPQRARRA